VESSEHFHDAAEDLPDAMPERWETAIEDLAQAIALGLDRGQDLVDLINDALRTRPVVAKAIGAAVAGAILGTLVASLSARRASRQRSQALAAASQSLVEQASTIARSAAARLRAEAPSADELRGTVSERASNVKSAVRPKSSVLGVRQARYIAQLLPLVIALLKNPLVRDMIVRTAMRSTRPKR